MHQEKDERAKMAARGQEQESDGPPRPRQGAEGSHRKAKSSEPALGVRYLGLYMSSETRKCRRSG